LVQDGSLVENVEYELEGTPCEQVVGKTLCSHPRGVAEEFPHDLMLRELGVQAYVGVPLFDSQGTPMGIIAALYRSPLSDPAAAESIVQICSSRVASELEYLRANAERDGLLRSAQHRVVELEALHALSQVVAESVALDELFQHTAALIPRTSQCGANLSARVVFDGVEYDGADFEVGEIKHTAEIVLDGAVRGSVELHCPNQCETSLLFHPRDFVRTIADVVSAGASRLEGTQALRSSEERLRQIAETTKDVFWLEDWATKKTIFASGAYETIWGRSLDDLCSGRESWADAIVPEDRERAWKAFTSLSERGSYDEEYRIVNGDGSIRWIRDQACTVLNEHGEIYRVAGVAEDITAHRVAEAKLAMKEKQLRSIMDASLDQVWLVDNNLMVLYANHADRPSLPAELGQSVLLSLPEEEREETCKHLERALRSGVRCRYESHVDGASGRSFFETTLNPLRLDEAVVGLTVNRRDISERRRAEETLR